MSNMELLKHLSSYDHWLHFEVTGSSEYLEEQWTCEVS